MDKGRYEMKTWKITKSTIAHGGNQINIEYDWFDGVETTHRIVSIGMPVTEEQITEYFNSMCVETPPNKEHEVLVKKLIGKQGGK